VPSEEEPRTSIVRPTIVKVRKTQEGGWIVLAFPSFSPTEVTG